MKNFRPQKMQNMSVKMIFRPQIFWVLGIFYGVKIMEKIT